MANAYTYGTGVAGQFTDGTQRQVLELGDKIHMYNPDMTPLLTLGGRVGTNMTPVPIFEWMEDEFFTLKSVVLDVKAADVADTATAGINGDNSVVTIARQAQMEYFEVGAIYSAAIAGGSAALTTAVTHFICVAIGDNVNTASANPRQVQFLSAHKHATLDAYNVEAVADSTDMITADAAGKLTLTYVANAGTFYAAGVESKYSGKDGLFQAETAFADADYYMAVDANGGWNEGAAIGYDTSKKVRRLSNCTQIFREPYTITGTTMASSHYGGDELSRLQARKLAKFKTDIEWALLTNGDISLDATAENPKRTFAGFGINGSAGAGIVQSLDGRDNTALQWAESSGTLAQFDALCEQIFQDMIGGTQSKTVLCSNRWLRKLAAVTNNEGTMNVEMGADQKAGLRVTSFHGAIGDLDFVVHPMLNGALDDMALVVDFTNFAWRPLSGRDVQLRSDVVKDGRDGRTDEWLMEGGPEVRNEQTHAIIKLT